MLKILVIGNGFDLSHGLATKYSDFLNFMKLFTDTAFSNEKEASDLYNLTDEDADDEIRALRKKVYEHTIELNHQSFPSIPKENLTFLFSCGRNNSLVRYFRLKAKRMNGQSHWVDFEKELENIISDYGRFFRDAKQFPLKFEYQSVWGEKNNKTAFWGKIKRDLEKLRGCLAIYLKYCLDYSSISSYPSEIYNQNFDRLLSFNYTNTYNIVAESLSRPLITGENAHYIHGSVDGNSLDSSDNIVLGIQNIEPENFEIIYFKKVFQRFQKHTGINYANWLNEDSEKTVTFFGHSLDETDGDVIRKLVNSSSHVTVYYHSQSDYEHKVINLMRIFSVDGFESICYNDRKFSFEPISEDVKVT